MGGAGSPCQCQPQGDQGQDQGAERKGCREGAHSFLHTSERAPPGFLPCHRAIECVIQMSGCLVYCLCTSLTGLF